MEKRIYRFGHDECGADVTEGTAHDNYTLGGKGANLAEMARIGLPVPPGFTITCQTCMDYARGGNAWPAGTLEAIAEARADLEQRCGKRLGDAADPLLVSVRSGAPISMPGMMDTVLDLGLNDESVLGLAAQTGNDRFAWDSYRRFIQMFANVVMGIDSDLFEHAITRAKAAAGVTADTELDAAALQGLVSTFKQIFAEHVSAAAHPELAGKDGAVAFPQDPEVQLTLAVAAVFGSWDCERARLYRRQNDIADNLGTAVNVQAMAFGNKGETSASGVAFTRNPATGEREFYGDYLVNAQGEDVVAGIRNTRPIEDLRHTPGLEAAGEQLERIFGILEQHYRDMMDIEFTIEQGKLYMLQTRVGKRTATAALKIAVDLEREGVITREEALLRINPAQLDQLMHPQIAKGAERNVIARGLNASPGAAVGGIVFSAADAVAEKEAGRDCVLVRWETTPDDLAGMTAAKGILTSHGGKTSHAAVIARGMGKPCVCGVDALRIDAARKEVAVAGTDLVLHEGDVISIDGGTGEVMLGAVALERPGTTGDLATVLGWADDVRRLGVRANADNPADARLSLELGAEGIGLTRTEHMFLGARKSIIQRFILADTSDERASAAEELSRAQEGDFYEILSAMNGLPVTIRLLDPPLHEFLDNPRDLAVRLAKMECEGASADELARTRALLARIDALSEANPMLGLRGCRLGFAFPELPVLQTHAIARATVRLKREGKNPRPHIMVPLVCLNAEIREMRAIVERAIIDVEVETGVRLGEIPVGTMIELPRAAVMADRIARHADFFSFGTNDLTQTALGFSRDDVEGKVLPAYLEGNIIPRNPFETVDEGVAKLVGMGCELGRAARPGISLGVCGEHGGDPDSIRTFYDLGLDYVSCSPYRVPQARLAAAQATLTSKVRPYVPVTPARTPARERQPYAEQV
ncbi:pyruvate phosphate dikinase [Parolsenella catena]|uniref:Pyruvate, phosphate dikinase n=2 Tax=Parolsenella catena TaxID=2003188 RepID=A0A3G9KAY4_9ACTN|nr:pyruvate, phosphate dikinase [Parolsenella catena]BBH50595.1 pyruvate phosphate dikinase [Parolsenella catena]